jgi:hypothetical protein
MPALWRSFTPASRAKESIPISFPFRVAPYVEFAEDAFSFFRKNESGSLSSWP